MPALNKIANVVRASQLTLAWNYKGINPLRLTKPTSLRLWPLLYIDYMMYTHIYRQFMCAQQEEFDYILYSPFECGMSASCKLMHALCMTQLKSSLGIYRDVHFSSLPIVIGYYSDYYCSSGNVYNGSIDSPPAVHLQNPLWHTSGPSCVYVALVVTNSLP